MGFSGAEEQERLAKLVSVEEDHAGAADRAARDLEHSSWRERQREVAQRTARIVMKGGHTVEVAEKFADAYYQLLHARGRGQAEVRYTTLGGEPLPIPAADIVTVREVWS